MRPYILLVIIWFLAICAAAWVGGAFASQTALQCALLKKQIREIALAELDAEAVEHISKLPDMHGYLCSDIPARGWAAIEWGYRLRALCDQHKERCQR